MPGFRIHSVTGHLVFKGEAENISKLFESRNRTNIKGCDLSLIDFSGQNLDGFQFEMCNLRRANFENASLVGSVFWLNDMQGAEFRGANLSRSRFWYSRFSGNRFEGARLSWESHELIAKIVLDAYLPDRNNSLKHLHELAGVILTHNRLCWPDFDRLIRGRLRQLACDILSPYAKDDPSAPPELVRAIARREAGKKNRSVAS